MLPPQIVKQPHYVWRFYLEAWEVRGKLHVLRNGDYFASAAKGVAKEGGFHDLRQLSEDDIRFIVETSIRRGSPQEKQHLEFVALLDSVQKACSTVLACPDQYDEPTVAWANKLLHDTEEQLQSSVEDLGEPWLRALREGDCSFLNEPAGDLFFYYIAMQYLRTKAMARSMVANLRGSRVEGFTDQVERTWPLVRQIHAVDIAANLHRMRSDYDLVFLDNESEVDFIAGDQPIVNIHAVARRDKIPEHVEFYYPLSPRLAMLWTRSHRGMTGQRFRIAEPVVQHHNGMMAEASCEMIFATSKRALGRYSSSRADGNVRSA